MLLFAYPILCQNDHLLVLVFHLFCIQCQKLQWYRSKENFELKVYVIWLKFILVVWQNFFYFVFFLKLSYTSFYCRIAKITDFNINWGYWHKMSNFIWICLILKCNHFCTDFWTPPLCLLCNQMFCQVLINQRGINSMTAELIWFWATELIITSPQKSCRSLFQPAPPPTPLHLKIMGQTQDGGNGEFSRWMWDQIGVSWLPNLIGDRSPWKNG